MRPCGDGVWFRFLIRAPQGAEEAIRAFRRRGIEAKRPVFLPCHRYLSLRPKDFPEAERAHREVVSVPLYPALKEPQVRRILDAMAEMLPS